ncbi:hypothetical protein PG993_010509 [Apiospora rasikravindrae]|uniref:Uncharacterized protein n=1 Tax=Apiospora rasikravindrae TaxID=990691 RepID=A0ABR1SMH0_9PEZI
MAGNRPRNTFLREQFKVVRSFLSPNAADEYVKQLVAEEVQRSHGKTLVTSGGSRDNANTPFGFQVPSIGYALANRPEPKSIPKPIYKASGTGGNTWIGGPALLTEEDDPNRPETIAKVMEGIHRPWTEGKHPQQMLEEPSPFQCWCGMGRPGLNKCETCGLPYRATAPECDNGKTQKRNPRKRTRKDD